jgi:hypothetical protein
MKGKTQINIILIGLKILSFPIYTIIKINKEGIANKKPTWLISRQMSFMLLSFDIISIKLLEVKIVICSMSIANITVFLECFILKA